MPSYLFLIKATVNLFGVKRATIALHRSSNDFISPDQFRRLSLPSLKMLVERLADEGIDVDPALRRQLGPQPGGPAGAAGRTVRRPVRRGHRHLQGQGDNRRPHVHLRRRPRRHAGLGLASEVDEYCHRLIEEVGKGGGFILGTGCEVAPNAKPENVKAMMESVVKYGYYER